MARWASLSIVFTLLLAGATTTAQDAPPRIALSNARNFRGKVATICGVVVSSSCRAAGRATTLHLTQGVASPMEIVIPSSVSAVLGDGRVENRFLQQGVCATGLISKGLEGEEIVIDDASHLTVEQALPSTPFAPHAHSACEPTTTLPKLITAVKPNYVAAAMRKTIQGMVLVEGVVEANGLIGDARVVTPLDPDLDQEALKAFRGWRFEPGTFMGEPAPVIITVEMHFSRK